LIEFHENRREKKKSGREKNGCVSARKKGGYFLDRKD
jgi:hypothetical protein